MASELEHAIAIQLSSLAPRPQTPADTGLSQTFLADLMAKHLLEGGALTMSALVDRLAKARVSRPLLGEGDLRARIAALLAERAPAYAALGEAIDTTDLSPDDVAGAILDRLGVPRPVAPSPRTSRPRDEERENDDRADGERESGEREDGEREDEESTSPE